jgi:hypothetical protein
MELKTRVVSLVFGVVLLRSQETSQSGSRICGGCGLAATELGDLAAPGFYWYVEVSISSHQRFCGVSGAQKKEQL